MAKVTQQPNDPTTEGADAYGALAGTRSAAQASAGAQAQASPHAGKGNVLDRIAATTRERVAAEKRAHPLAEVAERARELAAAELAASPTGAFAFPFEAALRAPGMSFICECKKASPSKGLIAPDFDPVAIAREYEAAGAAAISCLTEPTYFQGEDAFLTAIAQAVGIPVLRKDFVVDEYMVYQAKAIGAQAVLLICSILNDDQLTAYVALAHELGLTALVEAYEPDEVPRAIAAGARVIGVNNRDLRTFDVDFGRSIELRPLVGPDRVFVSESGVQTRADVARLEGAGVDAVLIGETLMRAPDKCAMLDELRGWHKTPGEQVCHLAQNSGGASVPLRIKCCGMFREEDIAAVNEARPDLCGFIVDFPKSHRSVPPKRVGELSALLDPGIAPVGVFVDEDPDIIVRLVRTGAIRMVQLHGHEDAAYLLDLRHHLPSKTPVIQAFRVRTAADVEAANASLADLVLLDNGQGTGESFDWTLLDGIGRAFMLAGGLNPQNVGQAIRELHARPCGKYLWGVDMSSGIETNKLKDPAKIKAAVAAVRRASNGE